MLVQGVAPGSAAARALLRPGDVLSEISTPAWRQPLRSPLDLDRAEIERPGDATVFGRRDGKATTWCLPAGAIGLKARPDPDAPARDDLWLAAEEAASLRESDAPAALALLVRAAERARLASEHSWASRLLQEAADLLSRQDAAREGLLRRALALEADLDTGGPGWAVAATSLAGALLERRRTGEAQALLERALVITERRAAGSLASAEALRLLASIARSPRGDLTTAELSARRALALVERLDPGAEREALCLMEVAAIAISRLDTGSARPLQQRAFELLASSAPTGPSMARCLVTLAVLEKGAKRYDAAEQLNLRALSILSRDEPEGADVGRILHNLGSLAGARRDFQGAERWLRRALTHRERIAPGSLDVARTLNNLGAALREDEVCRFEEAEAVYLRSLAIIRLTTPGSGYEVETLQRLAELDEMMGRRVEAMQHLSDAADRLDGLAARQGVTADARSRNVAQYQPLYQHLAETLLALGDRDGAFDAVERSRARLLLSMQDARQIPTPPEIPAELTAEQARLGREYDRLQQDVAVLLDDASSSPIRARLLEISFQLEELARTVRRLSPRYAEWRDPRPLPLSALRAALPDDTVFVATTAVGWETLVFVLKAGAPLRVVRVPEGASALGERVRRLRSLVERRRLGTYPSPWRDEAASLFDLLLAPALPELTTSRRLVVCPDGPLRLLPFAALIHRGTHERFLGELVTVETTASATAFVREESRPRRPPSRTAVILGDPALPATHPLARSLPPLPHSGKEAAIVAAAFGPGAASVHVGADATEERATSARADVLHFACHAAVNETTPLDSALMLAAAPGSNDNGLLQAWEILQLRLDADLVTLSACETSLGEDRQGEGLLSLTQAFRYAGAHAVLASLWRVSDESTAELMRLFYTSLTAGRSKAEALRDAQLDLARGSGGFAHPFFWAGFVLEGDGR